MRSYEERAKDFIKEIFPYIKGNMDSPYYVRAGVRQFNADHTRSVLMRSGCARIALITSDYVVKFDYDEDEVASIGGSENEVHLYEIAVKEGFDYLFAKITPVIYEGARFYIMPRIHGISDDNERGWHYMTHKEVTWCKSHSLTDLHNGNFGFRNGRICIVDYGFQEELVEECSYESEYECDSETVSVS